MIGNSPLCCSGPAKGVIIRGRPREEKNEHRSGSGGIQVGKEQEKKGPRKPGLFEGVLTLHLDLEGGRLCTLESWNAVSVGYHLAFLRNKQI